MIYLGLMLFSAMVGAREKNSNRRLPRLDQARCTQCQGAKSKQLRVRSQRMIQRQYQTIDCVTERLCAEKASSTFTLSRGNSSTTRHGSHPVWLAFSKSIELKAEMGPIPAIGICGLDQSRGHAGEIATYTPQSAPTTK